MQTQRRLPRAVKPKKDVKQTLLRVCRLAKDDADYTASCGMYGVAGVGSGDGGGGGFTGLYAQKARSNRSGYEFLTSSDGGRTKKVRHLHACMQGCHALGVVTPPGVVMHTGLSHTRLPSITGADPE